MSLPPNYCARELEGRGLAIFTNGQTEEILPAPSAPRLSCSPTAAASIRTSSYWPSAFGPTSRWRAPRSSTSIAVLSSATIWRQAIATSTRLASASNTTVRSSGWWRRFGIRRGCAARGWPAERHVYVPPPVFTSLKITGVDVFSAGALAAADPADQEITLHDAKRGLYKKVILRDDRIVGCVLYGSVSDGPWYVRIDARQDRRIAVSRSTGVRPWLCRAGDERSAMRKRRRCRRKRAGLQWQAA